MSIEFDDGLAAALSTTSRSIADELQSQGFPRKSAAETAATDFSGPYAKSFTLACNAEAQDRGALAGVLHDFAEQIEIARTRAQEEKARIEAEADWRTREDQRLTNRSADPTGQTYALEAAGDPQPSATPIPPPTVTAAFKASPRSRSGGGAGSGKTSAKPSQLRTFVTQSRGHNSALEGLLSRTQTAWAGFTAGCAWVSVGNVSFLTGFTGLLRENQADVVWIEHIARAFEHAGGLGTLPNALLEETLARYDARLGANRSHPLLEELFGNPLKPGGLKPAPTAEEVMQWWQALSDAQRADLISTVPLVIGNLDGVPISTRVEANALTAHYFAAQPGIPELERTYWESVANGTTALLVSDPTSSRIVEMIGTLTPTTKRTVTYVPGTTAKMEGFYEGSTQAFSEYLVEQGSGETVAFVYKDGPWATWAGERRNSSAEAMLTLGEKVATFQQDVISLDPTTNHIPQNAITHSAGMTIESGAEISGAQFDNVISLSGSFLLDGWTPTKGTSYHHMQYDNEIINYLDGVTIGGTPHELTDIFTPHIFDGEGQGNFAAHNRINQGPDTNPGPLERAVKILGESR